MRDITITMPEGQADDLLYVLRDTLDEKGQTLHKGAYRIGETWHHLNEDEREQLEAEIALLIITIAQLEKALS